MEIPDNVVMMSGEERVTKDNEENIRAAGKFGRPNWGEAASKQVNDVSVHCEDIEKGKLNSTLADESVQMSAQAIEDLKCMGLVPTMEDQKKLFTVEAVRKLYIGDEFDFSVSNS
ncbi:hypothetical protein V6N13_138217 [Hibiscus sabdariffa]|uniref:Uncharacterized protein n=1 Tax=Hibiscus sabdariffa TaxID=183260 RepID=A0ABR2QDA9_9ROSI